MRGEEVEEGWGDTIFFFSFQKQHFVFPKLQASTRKAKTLLYKWPFTIGTKHSLPFFLK